MKRFYAPLRAPLNHSFWLDLSIRQTFPLQNFKRVNSPNFSPAKLSRYTVYCNNTPNPNLYYILSEYYQLNKLSTRSYPLTIYPLPSSINVY